VIRRAASACQLLLWAPLGYLAAIAVAGLRSKETRRQGAGSLRLVVLVPAHNEEAVLGETLSAMLATDYPDERRRVIVIADDCSDRTVEIAHAAGVEVWERVLPAPRGKGEALRWAFARLLESDGWDALVVIDADTITDAGAFRALEARLDDGADAVQARYNVANPEASVVARLAEVSFAAQSVLRPRGRAALGGSAKLQGNGMAFTRDLVERHGWSGEGLAEDVDFWFRLLRAGIRPVYAGDAVVAGAMPTDVAAARVQRFRWEAGRSDLARRHLLPGIREAIVRRDPILGEAVVSELLFPPLATTAALVGAAGALRYATGRRGARIAAAQAATLAGYALAGLHVSRAPRGTYLALALAPAVVVWKMAIKAESTVFGRRAEWKTTPRG